MTNLLFDPTHFAEQRPLARGSALRRWARRLLICTLLAVGIGAALLLFAPLL